MAIYSQLIPLSRMLVGSKPAHNSCIILAEINIIPDFQLCLVKYRAAEGPEEKFFVNCHERQAPLFRDPTEPPTNFHSHHSQGEVYLRQREQHCGKTAQWNTQAVLQGVYWGAKTLVRATGRTRYQLYLTDSHQLHCLSRHPRRYFRLQWCRFPHNCPWCECRPQI